MLLFLFFFGLALGAVTPSDVPEDGSQRSRCPQGWNVYGGRCYKYVASRVSWNEADRRCRAMRSHLVSIHSRAEHDFVKSLIQSNDPRQGPTWMGFNDLQREGSWRWSNGCRPQFLYWSTGQPDNLGRNEHCGQINFGLTRKWNDANCYRQFSFVCASIKCY